MKIVYINNLGYLASPSITDAKIKLEVSNEMAKKLSYGPLGGVGKYNKELNDFELVKSHDEGELRMLRESECFSVINRSFMGYLNLSEQQKAELQEGYQAGLDVTETETIPQKPAGLD